MLETESQRENSWLKIKARENILSCQSINEKQTTVIIIQISSMINGCENPAF